MLYTIYKIVCLSNPALIYVGSTKNYCHRIHSHKYYANQDDKNFYLYESIRENGGWENWECCIIENFESDNRHDATLREGFYIDTLNACLNMVKIHHTEELRKKAMAKAHKKYYEGNRDIIKQKRQAKSQTPEEQARLLAYRTRPEIRDRINASRRERRAKAKADKMNSI
jgi:group I intron endonuclease